MSFHITNFPQFLSDQKDPFITNLVSEETKVSGDIIFHLDGYIIPRMVVFEEYKLLNQYELLFSLYKKYGENFICYIKGVFNIVIIDKGELLIFNDRHSIKKVFTYSEGKFFFISNDLKEISRQFALKINKENAAIFCLFSHFLNGQTLFEKTTYSGPATKIRYLDRNLKISTYWSPNELFAEGDASSGNDSDFTTFWDKLITDYVEYLKPELISITLTGGNDSRMVLAPLLNKKCHLHAFSYGNPFSMDGVIAKKVAHSAKIDYHNYFIDQPTKEWFSNQADKVISLGDTMINIHRAHRNDASEMEVAHNPNSQMIFTGLMGGEYLKEPSYDNIVLPKIFKKLNKNNKSYISSGLIINHLRQAGISSDEIVFDKLYAEILPYLDLIFHPDPLKRKFLLTCYHYGCRHHSQDAFIFNYHCKHVINPFMDIDFLEKLSSSPNWYVNNRNNPFRKVYHSRLYVKTTHELAPELSKVPYAKRGQYTADDLINHPLAYLLKRFKYLVIKDKLKYPSSFPMGNWLYQFSKEQLESLHPEVNKLFVKDFLTSKLERNKLKTTEDQWHPVTNPINLSLYLKAYEKN